MFDCIELPLHQTLIYQPSPTASLERSLRDIRGAASWASVLILSRIKLNVRLSSCTSFLADHLLFYPHVHLINIHNMKVENYILFGGIFRTSSPGDSISSEPERTAPRRQGMLGEESGYVEVLQQRSGSLNFKSFCFLQIKENQISQVKEFSAFLCMLLLLLSRFSRVRLCATP